MRDEDDRAGKAGRTGEDGKDERASEAQRLELPVGPPSRVDRTSALLLLGALVALSVFAVLAAGNVRSGGELIARLQQPSSAEQREAPSDAAEGGRAPAQEPSVPIWGAGTAAPTAGEHLLCELRGMRSRKDGDTVVFRQLVHSPGTIRMADGRTVQLDEGADIELVSVAAHRQPPNAPGFAAHVPRGRSPDYLRVACLGQEQVFVDGCVASTGRLGACGFVKLRLLQGESPEPLLRRGTRWVAPTVCVAVFFWLLTLALLSGIGASASASGVTLARRHGVSPKVIWAARKLLWPSLACGLALGAVSTALGALGAPRWMQVSLLAVALLLVLLHAGAALARRHIVSRARQLLRSLAQSSLAELSARDGQVELSLCIPEDAPTIAPAFLRERCACVQVRGAAEARNHTRPERVVVRDASGSAELDLGAFEIAGWRSVVRVDDTRKEPPELLVQVDAALGSHLAERKEAALVWTCWAFLPGDRLYVVGEAPSVRGGVGAYRRAGGSTTIGTDGEAAALAVLGSKEALSRALRVDALLQVAVAVLALASLLPLGYALLLLAG